jgi:radical SAM protein with 4Fe4S-binding SPASM domain
MLGRIRESGKRIAPAGMHHWRTDDHRFHLRVEDDGRGLLTIDASRIVHLNPVACDSAWMILSGTSAKRMVERIRSRYRIDARTARSDHAEFQKVFEGIISSGACDTITYLNLDILEPFQTPVSAPYRIDLALTYRCNVSCSHCYNNTVEKAELETDQWKEVLRRIRDQGIPHVVFTGGEATLREDLADLIGHAESLGLVTGLLTNGVRLADAGYLASLIDAGLDHIQVTLESADPEVHNSMTGADCFDLTVKGIENCVSLGVHTITNTTLTRMNVDGVRDVPEFTRGLGLEKFALNAVIHSGRALEGDFALEHMELESVMIDLTEKADELGMGMIWYSPTRYCSFNPLEFDLGPKRCTAAEYNLCVEPDGSVLPCQSWYEPVGNILTDDWESIWQSELMVSAREHRWADPECRNCTFFSMCGGGCPLEKKSGVACRDST